MDAGRGYLGVRELTAAETPSTQSYLTQNPESTPSAAPGQRVFLLLHLHKDPTFLPELLQIIVLPLVGREQMYNHVAVIDHDPPLPGLALFAAVLPVLAPHGLQRRVRQCVQHAVASARTQHEVVCERSDFLDIQQQNGFSLFGLQGSNDRASKLQCVQMSPQTNLFSL